MAEVTLEPVGPERREAVANLFQLYVHDFSDFWSERQVELGEDGRFPPYPFLDTYWEDPERAPFLIRADGQLAGFVLLNTHSHSGKPCDWNVAEFFVARHYRREGVGRRAALAAISGRPGLWEIAVARRNAPAQPFWRGVAQAAASGPVEALDQADGNWNGLILRFRVA
ncbi:GNAT family N-acetyltransferase [Phenylobacterium sp. J367]|uniref:GNAT family N-acetyltransferase n=1 Tax=Phenylobacterium sp. J367 TaxID=2898435 RepID=UPI00215164BB|nr:GNAT family N-acetyltransferase [Phenylobacterium sp. J367]MCR5880792.1 GNAT family N-acetyltransferase [Phenylobacterium sp. J367]